MKMRYLLLFLLMPCFSWASTHIINQSFFLTSTPPKSWSKDDRVIVIGSDRIKIQEIVKARKNYSRFAGIYWLLSDEQWYFNNINLDKDQKAQDFANQLLEFRIRPLAENLCPKPVVFHEKTHDIVVVDSSWFLFSHQNELFAKTCGNIDVGRFYTDVEEAILNAKLKPIVFISYHSIHPKLTSGGHQDSIAKIATKIQQSMGPLNTLSNPAYQKYQDKINHLINMRNNIVYVSGDSENFAFGQSETENNRVFHVALPKKTSHHLLIKSEENATKITTKNLSKPILLQFNPGFTGNDTICDQYTGGLHDFKMRNSFYRYFLGLNYRKFWIQPVSVPCFDLEKERLIVVRIDGSIRSPDFQLRDTQGRSYLLRPLIQEIRMPSILEGTIVEDVMLDQQSSFFPLGFLLASMLSKQAGIPAESAKLVYIDAYQKAFTAWREKKFPSGYYQLIDKFQNITKNPELKKKGILEIISTKEMVHRVENVSGYRINQQSYLRARLFDILIGDWDRQRDHWAWIVLQKDGEKILEPFPLDRDAAFYRADGAISWWRKRRWLNYELRDYGRKLKNPEPMMVQSLAMDHRYTFALTQKDWDDAVKDLLEKLPADSMKQAISALPITLPNEDRAWLIKAFQQRHKDLPKIARKMRQILKTRPDIIGTPGPDTFYIQSGPGRSTYVTMYKNNQATYTEKFDAGKTKEIRIYGLNEKDEFKLNWEKHNSIKINLIPGDGQDTITARGSRRPTISLYDETVDLDSNYEFLKKTYEPIYNDYYSQLNQRKLNYLAPVLFLASSNADSGFILGGGVKYFKEGFQHSPWKSTNEFKGNIVFNRKSANLRYEGTQFDTLGKSDFETLMDGGLPRFYGSFFGLGNSPPGFDPTKDAEYYWMRARHFETEARLDVPIFQNIFFIPRLQFRFRDYLIDQNSIFNDPADNELDILLRPGTNANITNASYYIGTGISLKYLSEDTISGPIKKRTIKAEGRWMISRGFTHGDGYFQTFDFNTGLTGYFTASKTQWKIGGGFGRNFGHWEFFDAQFLGQGQDLRGFFMNRFAGHGRVFSSIEVNQSFLFRKRPVLTDYGLGTYFDNGRVFLENDPGDDTWHMAVGAQGWMTVLNSVAFKVSYAHPVSESGSGFWSFVLTTEL